MKPDPSSAARPWKGVIFHCCGVYGRVYQDARTGEWKGNCPRCARPTVLSMLLLLLFLLLPKPGQAEVADTAKTQPAITTGLDIFVQPGVQFLGFEDRERYQTVLDTLYARYRSAAGKDSAKVTKQDFQKVNFCFPVSAGLQWRFNETHAVAAGVGYFHNRESVVLSESDGELHEFYYALQGVPAYLEYRLGISHNLLTLRNQDQFSILARWYWFLPGTEIYSSWGSIPARSDWLGNGWGVSLGYHLFSWKRLSIFSDLGFTSLRVDSDSPWSDVVPDTTGRKASWELGGIQLQFRASFGAYRR